MTTKPYDFNTQKAIGAKGEEFLDLYFTSTYEITPATDTEQRQGIDRWFTDRESGRHFSVEYKTDSTATKTHRAFIETMSNLEHSKQGWIYTSQADYLIYYVPGKDYVIYWVRFEVLRRAFRSWALTYPVKKVPNRRYTTCGLVVPLHELEVIASIVY